MILLSLFLTACLIGLWWSHLEVKQSHQRIRILVRENKNGTRLRMGKIMLQSSRLLRAILFGFAVQIAFGLAYLITLNNSLRNFSRLGTAIALTVTVYKAYSNRHERRELIEEWHQEDRDNHERSVRSSNVG